MGFWNKLGKIALVAAPYVAAPFTGGTSLMATGLANKAAGKWAESDAKKRAAKGLAPSSFDKHLLTGANVAGLASSFTGGFGLGNLGKAAGAASTAGKVAGAADKASKLGKFASTLDKVNKGMAVASAAAPFLDRGGERDPSVDNRGGLGPTTLPSVGRAVERGGVMPRGGFRHRDNPMNQRDQSSPNLAESIFQGRQEAIGNQGFRRGYTVNAIGRDEVPYSYDMPRIRPTPPREDRRENRRERRREKAEQ